MKTIITTLKVFILSTILFSTVSNAGAISGMQPTYDKVYRSDRIGDSYHFLILTKSKKYYYVYTNRTDKLTATELKSSNLLQILKKKQSWGQSFPKKGSYTVDNGKIYTKLLWDRIKILAPNKIKYLNKVFYLK